MFSTIASSALGVAFWLVGARVYSAEELGRAAAAVSAITLLSGLAQMSLSSVMVRFLPTAGSATGRMLGYSQTAVASVSVILAAGFWLLGLGTSFLPADRWTFIIFCAAVAGQTLAAVHDGAFTGLGRILWVPGRTVASAALRVVLLAVLAGTALLEPALLSWSLPGIALALFTCVVLALPGFRRADPAVPESLPTRRELTNFAGSQYLSGLLATFATSAPPLAVAAVLGAATNGTSFYIPWLIATVAGALAWNVVVSMVVAVAKHPEGARVHIWHAARLLLLMYAGGGAVLAAGAPYILAALGPQYAAGGTATLRIIALAMPFQIIGALYAASAVIRKRTWQMFGVDLAGATIFLGGGYWALTEFGVLGVAGASLATKAVLGLGLIVPTMRNLRSILAESDRVAAEAAVPEAERLPARGVASVPRVAPGADSTAVTLVFFPAEVDDWLGKAETTRFARIGRHDSTTRGDDTQRLARASVKAALPGSEDSTAALPGLGAGQEDSGTAGESTERLPRVR
jgi:O-antigen/teichoic acid export membrane protein